METLRDQKVETFLHEEKIGFLGLADSQQPYVVPLNFVWWQDSIYFHGAERGRKTDIMRENTRVCFTVCEHFGTLVDPIPAKTDTAYMSVIVF